MKNFTRLARLTGRYETFTLLDNAGDPVQTFDLFVNSLVREGLSPSTVTTYSNHIASFLDYLTEAKVFGFPCEQLELWNAIKGYLPARLAGENACGDFNIISRRTLGQKRLTKAAAKNHTAAINKFLFESEAHALHLRQIEEWEGGISEGPSKQLFQETARQRSGAEIKRIYQSSMMVNVMNHHPKIARAKIVKVRGKDNNPNRDKDFPAEHILSLLDCASCARDEALWALSAGTGVRPHEALLLEMDHIDFERRKVVIEDPDNRRFASQMPDELQRRWKGRAVSETYFIPILRDRFFKALERYIRTEYIPIPNQRLVFQSLRGDRKPYFEVADKNRIQSFRRAVRRVQKRLPSEDARLADLTPHSLRHFYGTFMLNYVPLGKNQYGLRPVEVQRLMGHEQLQSTLKYARQDKIALDAKILLMNMHAMNEAPEVDQLLRWIANKYADSADRLNRAVAARQIGND
ncbi:MULTISPECIES: site-specific integrase [unclassified Sulfitobacter]|uniref:tyrosine-type recombinase/integrase n=1 Tax=unclassified Sulfitobacter TaxID=196795 RepID=UPI0023E32E0A|nr:MULTISPECIES: site-specific integrase [unclassified Sulfitobacter]MDF3384505.1 site-specific integrase [Sulfitobacter sp. Ks11]MDF3387923.1 site-specific integrase [Sulfitobacter sp. M85]MDF3391343.1 site-specific integrase [Sulfitobacter sp. Ks16]MDF3401981.1 site-specific integrase [Sulfitobacter sp. KE39]MDF3405402.1 site-specific integrase [Sulfitobacter sp. Ks35]